MNAKAKQLVADFKEGKGMIYLSGYYGLLPSEVEEIIRRAFSLPKAKITRKYRSQP